jgi:HEAT repeat protein
LHDKNWQTQAAAARAIGQLGEDGRDGVPELAVSLRNKDWRVAEPVVESLSRIGVPAIPVLIDGLQDPALPVRWGSARALGAIGADAADAAPALADALDDDQVMVRWAAANALWAIGPGANQATEALNAGLSDEQWIVRWAAARALGGIVGDDKPPGDETVSALANALRDEDSRVCEAAAFALEDIGMPAREALPALGEAATGVGGTGSGACKVIDVGPAAHVRWAAVRALGVVGAGNRDALAALNAALQDEEWQVRGVAALALGQFGNDAPQETITALINGLSDDDAPV